MENIDSKNFNTLEDFQSFIYKHNIQNPTEFRKYFPRLYDKLVRLKLAKQVKYCGKYYADLSYLKLPSDFQKFIDDNNIDTPVEFDRRFGTIYCRLCRLGYASMVTYKNPRRPNSFYYLKTLEDFQNYIDTNNVQNMKDLKKNHRFVCSMLIRSEFRDKVIFPNVLRKRIKESTLEGFQKFVDDNNIKNASEFNAKYKPYYTKMVKLGLSRSIVYPEPKYNIELLKNLNKLSDFQDFIDKNDIQSASELLSKFPPVYHKLSTLKLHDQVSYPEEREDLSYLNNPEDFQKFIDENEIKSPLHLFNTRGDIYRRLQRLGFCGQVDYLQSNKSLGEIEIENLLDSLDLEYVYNQSADFLSGKTRLDFRLDRYMIAIEYQGMQHFKYVPVFNRSLEEQCELDKIKHDECIDAGYIILYASFPAIDRTLRTIDFENLEYFDKIYTSFNELKNKILDIIGFYENYNEDVND